MAKVKKARANGYYTRGRSQFRLRAGQVLPKVFDDIFYHDEDNPRDAGVGLASRRLQQFASSELETTDLDEDVETTSEDEDGDEEA